MLKEEMKVHLKKVYGDLVDENYFKLFYGVLEEARDASERGIIWDEKEVFLITYGDTFLNLPEVPLKSLCLFLENHLKETFSTVHILPFFPYSSDDGFAVKNFYEVNPELGSWDDVRKISRSFRLMADLVVNHASSHSEWFEQFLADKEPGNNFFYVPDEGFEVANVIRPRRTPLITNYQSFNGVKQAWTTFSSDQVDLNYRNPMLLLEMIRVLLWYIRNGAGVIRLDAIAFLWKESGTTCVHLPETHEIVRLIRHVMDYCAPGSVLITETNVPHLENISYFGEGDEAHMVYQFPLPPLLLYTLNSGDGRALTSWAATLKDHGAGRTWFNFTASHDGIGVRPLEGLVGAEEKGRLIENMKCFGGLVSNRRSADGGEEPYEINITYFDALKGTGSTEDEFQVERFLCSQLIMLGLKGVPAIYVQSLFGAGNDYNGAAQQMQNRAINRKKYTMSEVREMLAHGTHHATVFKALKRFIAIRTQQSAFHPDAEQEIVDVGSSFFAFIRRNPISGQHILCISNVTKHHRRVVAIKEMALHKYDLIEETHLKSEQISLKPYQTVWLV